jgi:3',5'-cyclic-AMP phosphodiesterase
MTGPTVKLETPPYDAAMPFSIVQMTDPHIGANWSENSTAALARAVDAVRNLLREPPNAVIVTGDLANTPSDAEYETARELLGKLGAPLYVMAGNHDDREKLCRHFEVPDTDPQLLRYALDFGPLRLIALDTKRPDSDAGQIEKAQLAWLDRVLDQSPTIPTLIAMHHPPLLTGIPAMDRIGIPAEERDGLEEVLGRHQQVQLVACGHVHRALIGRIGAASVLALPSTDVQLVLDLQAGDLQFCAEPPCFAVHLLAGDRIVSHIQPVTG